MSEPVRGFLSAASAERFRTRTRARFWEMRYDLSDPKYQIRLWRQDPTSKAWAPTTTDPVRVVVERSTYQPERPASGVGADADFNTGQISRFGEWDVREGDMFRLGETDARITDTPIRTKGVTVANFRIGLSAGEQVTH